MKRKPSKRKNPPHREPDRLFLYWHQIFWGLLNRVRRKDPVLFKGLLDQITKDGLLPRGGRSNELTRNEGITQDRLEQALKYRHGKLPSFRGKRREKVPVEGMALRYGLFLGLLRELKKIPLHPGRLKRFKRQLQVYPGLYIMTVNKSKQKSKIEDLMEHFDGFPTLYIKRPKLKALAQELTAIAYSVGPETFRVRLSNAKKRNPQVKDLLEIIDSNRGLTPIKSS